MSAHPTPRRIALFLGAFSLVHCGKKRESPFFRPCNLLPFPRPQNKMKGDGEGFPKMGKIREKKQIPNKCMLESGKYKFQCSTYKFHYSILTEEKTLQHFVLMANYSIGIVIGFSGSIEKLIFSLHFLHLSETGSISFLPVSFAFFASFSLHFLHFLPVS